MVKQEIIDEFVEAISGNYNNLDGMGDLKVLDKDYDKDELEIKYDSFYSYTKNHRDIKNHFYFEKSIDIKQIEPENNGSVRYKFNSTDW